MKGDLPACAVRLLSALPVRTHERAVYVHLQGSKVSRHIIIEGRRYDSIKQAKERLHVCTKTIQNWLANGKAQRA